VCDITREPYVNISIDNLDPSDRTFDMETNTDERQRTPKELIDVDALDADQERL